MPSSINNDVVVAMLFEARQGGRQLRGRRGVNRRGLGLAALIPVLGGALGVKVKHVGFVAGFLGGDG